MLTVFWTWYILLSQARRCTWTWRCFGAQSCLSIVGCIDSSFNGRNWYFARQRVVLELLLDICALSLLLLPLLTFLIGNRSLPCERSDRELSCLAFFWEHLLNCLFIFNLVSLCCRCFGGPARFDKCYRNYKTNNNNNDNVWGFKKLNSLRFIYSWARVTR